MLLNPNPDPNQIAIWTVNLKVSETKLNSLKQLLENDEKVRADRYKFDLHRQRFIVARASLRLILSRYLQSSQIEFSYSPKGKPFLASSHPEWKLEFNLSHSQDLAIYAVTWNSSIGIDLEYQRSIDRVQSLSERFLTEEESQIIQNSSSPEDTFLKIWTLKEAYLKATGCGLGKLSEVSTIWDREEIIGLAVNQIPINWTIYQFSHPVLDTILDTKNYIASLVSSIPKAIAFHHDELT